MWGDHNIPLCRSSGSGTRRSNCSWLATRVASIIGQQDLRNTQPRYQQFVGILLLCPRRRAKATSNLQSRTVISLQFHNQLMGRTEGGSAVCILRMSGGGRTRRPERSPCRDRSRSTRSLSPAVVPARTAELSLTRLPNIKTPAPESLAIGLRRPSLPTSPAPEGEGVKEAHRGPRGHSFAFLCR